MNPLFLSLHSGQCYLLFVYLTSKNSNHTEETINGNHGGETVLQNNASNPQILVRRDMQRDKEDKKKMLAGA